MSNIRWNPDQFSAAWDFATMAHHGQTFGGYEEGMRIDYINHIGSVLTEVLWTIDHSNVRNPLLAIHCAILHDVVEDTEYTYEDILERFGKEVAEGVQALTKNTGLPTKEDQMKDSLFRIKQQPYEVWIVKMADRITNIYYPPYYWQNDKILSYLKESELIYNELREANPLLAERLRNKTEEYKKFLQ